MSLLSFIEADLWKVKLFRKTSYIIRSGKTTPTDVAQHVISTLEALEKTDPPMYIIIQSNKQEILDVRILTLLPKKPCVPWFCEIFKLNSM